MSRKEFFWEFEEDFAGRFNQNPRMLQQAEDLCMEHGWTYSVRVVRGGS